MAPSAASKRSARSTIEDEIAQLRDLDVRGLQARWKIVFRKLAPPHLPKHLLFGVLAYKLQAEALGDINNATKRILEQSTGIKSRTQVAGQLEILDRQQTTAEAGTMLVREWKGRKHRVMVMAEGFAWNGKTYNSLSGVAFAMTGTRWNGPKFFGMRKVQGRPESRMAR